MEERLYTISVTKEEVEWVLNKNLTEQTIKRLEGEDKRWKSFYDESVETVRRLLIGIGYDPDTKEGHEIFSEEWFAEFEERFKSKCT